MSPIRAEETKSQDMAIAEAKAAIDKMLDEKSR
jgi:hypothetical protein